MRKLLLILLGFSFFTLLFTYPAIFHLLDKIIGDGGDNYQFLSFQFLANKQFLLGQIPFGWTNYWRYPVGFDFSTGYDSSLLLVLGIVLYQIIGNPVIVYNLSILALLFLNCFLSYLFFRKVTQKEILGFLGGIIYGFSFYVLARVGGHPNLLLTGCIPFLAYSMIGLWEKRCDVKSLAVFALASSLVFLSSLQYLLIVLGGLIFFAPLCFIFYRHEVVSCIKIIYEKKSSLLLSIAVVFAVFLFFNSAKVLAFMTHSLILPTPEIVSVPVINYLLPNVYLRTIMDFFANDTKKWIEYVVFLGFAEMALFLLFFITQVGRRLKLFIGANVAVFMLLALGDQGTQSIFYPYRYLFQLLPFRGIIEPGRFYIITYLFLTLGVLLYLKTVSEKKLTYIIVVLLAFLTLERFPSNFYLSDTLYKSDFLHAVGRSKSEAILDLPIFIDWWNGNKYDLYSIYYGKPIVNGYIHWSGNTQDTKFLVNKLKRFECNTDPLFVPKVFQEADIPYEMRENKKLLTELKGYGVTTVAVHKDLSETFKECQDAVKRIQILSGDQELHKLYEDTTNAVYEF